MCLKPIFLTTTKFWEAQKRFGGNFPEMPHRVCWPGQNRRQKDFHWRPSCLCRRLHILKIYISFITWTAFTDCAN